MSHHFYFPFISLLSTLFIVAGGLSRRYPQLLRPFGVIGGLLIMTMGILFPRFFTALPVADWLRWAFIFCGALLVLGAVMNGFATEQDEAPLRPATGRPPRHFGEAP